MTAKDKIHEIIEEYGCNPEDYSLPVVVEMVYELASQDARAKQHEMGQLQEVFRLSSQRA